MAQAGIIGEERAQERLKQLGPRENLRSSVLCIGETPPGSVEFQRDFRAQAWLRHRGFTSEV